MAVTVGGKPVDDTIFCYWAIISLSRAARFRAEAAQQLAQPCGFVLATIATYYSLFHLGVFLTFCVPRYLRPKVRATLDNDDLFVDALTWACTHHSDDTLKVLISAAVDHAEPFLH